MFACAPARRRTPSKRSRYRGGEGRRLSGRLRRLLAPVCVAEARRRCEGKAPRKERRAALGRRAARRSRPSEAPRALPAPTRGPGRTRCPQRSRRRGGAGRGEAALAPARLPAAERARGAPAGACSPSGAAGRAAGGCANAGVAKPGALGGVGAGRRPGGGAGGRAGCGGGRTGERRSCYIRAAAAGTCRAGGLG